LEDGGKTVFIDHHSDKSGRDSSATKLTYELLTSLGLLKKEKYLDDLVEFVTQLDNKTFPDEEKYFKDSWHTVLGLDQFMEFKNLADYFKSGRKPNEILSETDIKKIGGQRLLEKSQEQKKKIDDSFKELERMMNKGLIFDAGRYGQIAVDIGKKVPAGYDAAKAYGCPTYIIWDSEGKSFLITSREPIEDKFSQGTKVRERMWIKPRHDPAPLKITLGEILQTMTDGRLDPDGELKNYLEREAEQKEVENSIGLERMEKIISLGQRYYEKFMKEFSWKGYNEKRKQQKLKDQTEKFLAEVLKNFIKEDDAKIKTAADYLIEKIMPKSQILKI